MAFANQSETVMTNSMINSKNVPMTSPLKRGAKMLNSAVSITASQSTVGIIAKQRMAGSVLPMATRLFESHVTTRVGVPVSLNVLKQTAKRTSNVPSRDYRVPDMFRIVNFPRP